MKLAAMLLGSALLAPLAGTHAMSMDREGATLVMTGRVSAQDAQRFQEQLDDGALHQVILSESPGGDLKAALWIAHQISARKINTAVHGLCASACAIIFMGGSERQMIEGQDLTRTRLGFHGAYRANSRLASERDSERMRAWLYEASKGRFTGRLLDRAMTTRSASDMMLFYYPREDMISAWFCQAGTEPRPRACETIRGTDVIKAGILTTRTLLAVEGGPLPQLRYPDGD